MTKFVADIESTEIRPGGEVSRIHGGVIKVLGKANAIVFSSPGELQRFIREHSSGDDQFIMHYGVGFDMPTLLDHGWLEGYDPVDSVLDTLVMSRLLHQDRAAHSLESYGEEMGIAKSKYAEFEEWTDALKERCKIDVQITERLYNRFKVRDLEDSQAYKAEAEVQYAVSRQQNHGIRLNAERAAMLLATITEEQHHLREELVANFEPTLIEVGSRAQKNVEPVEVIRSRWNKYIFKRADGSEGVPWAQDRYKVVPFNPTSGPQIVERLMLRGWKPKAFTNPYSGKNTPSHGVDRRLATKKILSDKDVKKLPPDIAAKARPKSDEKTLDAVTGVPDLEHIQRYRMLDKKKGMVLGWMSAVVEETDLIHGYVNPIGTITHRMAHSSPHLGQVPKVGKPLGRECRECFEARPGFVMVGCDASSLELRCLAHYIGDQGYIDEVTHGDVHAANAALYFAISPEEVRDDLWDLGNNARDLGKTITYAMLYGAGDAKLGATVGKNAKYGAEIRERFAKGLPGMGELQRKIDWYAERGYIQGLDGRRIIIRSKHAALNTLLQSAGAIIMKHALKIASKKFRVLRAKGIEVEFLLNVHDEFQAECRPESAEMIGQILTDSIIQAGVELKTRCPLDAEYKIGQNWSETH